MRVQFVLDQREYVEILVEAGAIELNLASVSEARLMLLIVIRLLLQLAIDLIV